MTLLQAENIVAGYTEIDILHGVSIELNEGEIVSIVGPNGAGKSTLFRVIFGLLQPRKGKVNFKEEDVTSLETFERVKLGLGYVPQEENVFPSLTVLENLEMGGYVKENIHETIPKVFDIFPSIEGRKEERAKNLSGGERQMVAIGRALVLDPDVLLLDEPGAALAPDLKDMVYEKIKRINEAGTSLMIIEQNAKKALKNSDRGYVLKMGKNEYEGTGKELLEDKDILEFYLGG